MRGDDIGSDYLQKSTRRQILSASAGTLATGLAGCTGGESDSAESVQTDTQTATNIPISTASSSPAHEFKSPPYENVETEENGQSATVSGEIVLGKGQYSQQEFQLEEPTQIQITGINEVEGTMDLFLLSPESELEKYRERELSDFSKGLAETDIESIERSLQVSPGRYFLVFDNSAVYGAEPQGTVRFEFRVVLETRPQTPTETETKTPTETPRGENNAEVASESDMPKIRKVTDNFGHTFVWDPDEYHSDAYYFVSTDDEVVVSDDTTVALTVEEIWADPEDSITYTYRLQGSNHPDDVQSEVRSNTNTWNMQREDYTTEWGFFVRIRDQDEIYYQNEASQSDFAFKLIYTNLTLEE